MYARISFNHIILADRELNMSITEIMPLVETLPHADKLRLVHFLVSKLASEEKISLDQNSDSITQSPPKPVGRVYYSGRSDISVNARELLFKEKAEAIEKRRADANS